MDFLYELSNFTWNALGRLPLPFLALFLRFALYLSLLVALGYCVRRVNPPMGTPTLVLQIIAFSVSAAIVLPLSFHGLVEWGLRSRNTLLLASVLAWVVLPMLIPKFVIRRRGYQRLTVRLLYATEMVLLVIQLATSFVPALVR